MKMTSHVTWEYRHIVFKDPAAQGMSMHIYVLMVCIFINYFIIVLPLQQPVAASFLLYKVHISEVRQNNVGSIELVSY